MGTASLARSGTRGRNRNGRDDRRPAIFGLFLAFALLCGGAGSHYPLLHLLLELLALMLAVQVVRGQELPIDSLAWRVILLLFAAMALLLLVQIVPLPPTLWQGLPARGTAATIYDALGWTSRWHALSLTPDSTFAMLLTLLPPLAAFLAAAAGGHKLRHFAFQIIVAVALASTLLAALQVALGDGTLTLYRTAHRGYGVGFFVNRNHQAAYLLVAMLLCAVPGVLPIGRASSKGAMSGRLFATLAAIGLLALGVLATTSRTALVLLPLVLLASIALAVDMRRARRWIAGTALAYLLLGAALYPTSLVQRPLARLATAGEDLRQQYWENSVYLIGESLPWGTGFGSFDQMYRSAEPLDQVSPLVVNNAHNDFLETALEGGAPAILLLAAAVALAFGLLVQARRASVERQEKTQATVALGGITILLLFSIVDYPLRMTALSVVAAILLGCGVGRRMRRGSRPAANGSPVLRRTVAPVLAGLVALLVLVNGFSAALVERRMPQPALTIAPWSSTAWSQRASQAQIDGDAAASREAGLKALAIAPMDVAALRAVASADLATGNSQRGLHLFQLAAALGWRDRITQLWLIEQGMAAGNLPLAAERIDGLLRQGIMGNLLLGQMRAIFLAPAGERILADRLVERPSWRQGFFNAVADDGAAATPKLLWLIPTLRRAGIPIDPGATSLIRWRLGDAGQFAAVRAIWRASGGVGLVSDGGFEAVSAPPPSGAAPYAWRAPVLPGVRAVIAEQGTQGSRQSILLTSDGYAAGVALAQTIILPEGAYRLEAWLRSGGQAPGQAPTLALSCGMAAGGSSFAAARPVLRGTDWRHVVLPFVVPPGCAAQTIALRLPQTMGQPLEIGIDEVSVTAMRRNQ